MQSGPIGGFSIKFSLFRSHSMEGRESAINQTSLLPRKFRACLGSNEGESAKTGSRAFIIIIISLLAANERTNAQLRSRCFLISRSITLFSLGLCIGNKEQRQSSLTLAAYMAQPICMGSCHCREYRGFFPFYAASNMIENTNADFCTVDL